MAVQLQMKGSSARSLSFERAPKNCSRFYGFPFFRTLSLDVGRAMMAFVKFILTWKKPLRM